MFTIRITAAKFWGITQAANLFERSLGMSARILPLPYEGEPSVAVGEDVQIIVGGSLRYVGKVVEIKKTEC